MRGDMRGDGGTAFEKEGVGLKRSSSESSSGWMEGLRRNVFIECRKVRKAWERRSAWGMFDSDEASPAREEELRTGCWGCGCLAEDDAPPLRRSILELMPSNS